MMLAKGWYQATVDHIWPREGQHGEYLEWQFKIGNERLKSFTSSSLKNEKFQRYVRAVRGWEVEEGETFYPSDLAGQSCRVEVSIVQKGERQFNSVESVV
jgi:hypothetical protein